MVMMNIGKTYTHVLYILDLCRGKKGEGDKSNRGKKSLLEKFPLTLSLLPSLEEAFSECGIPKVDRV